MSESVEQVIDNNWRPPKPFQPEKKVGWWVIWFRSAWIALLVPYFLWPIIMQFIASEDTFIDVFVFASYIAFLGSLVHGFMLIMLGVPVIAFACMRMGSYFWKSIVLLPFVTCCGAVAMELVGWAFAQESLLMNEPLFLLVGAAYGLLTGFILYLKRPKQVDGIWK